MCYNWRGDIMKNNEEQKKNTEKKNATKTSATVKKSSSNSKNQKKSTTTDKKVAAKTNTKSNSTAKKTVENKKTNNSVKTNTKSTPKSKKTESVENKKNDNTVKANSNVSKSKKVETSKKKDIKIENSKSNNLSNKKSESKTISQTKNKKELVDNQESFITKDETRKVSIVIGVIALTFCMFFVVSKIMDKDKHSDIFSESLEVAEIQYKDILISKLLKQNPSEYYVLIEHNKDKNLNTYEGYITNYESYYSNSDIYKIYTAQLNNAFNKSYYGEKDSYETNNLSFSQTTLVKVSNGEITEAYIGNDISVKIQGLIEEASN